MQHPDLTVVEAEHEGEVLKIDQVREIQHSLSLAPYEARYRVALILRFEEAHSAAANAMLKTLEEPPPQVVVILTAKSVESLLPTIVSRCEVLRLRPLSVDETARGLQTIKGVPQESAEKLAHLSGGRPGYALRLFENPSLLEQRQAWLDELVRLLSSSRGERFAFAFIRSKPEDKEELRNVLQVWLTFWRDALIYAAGITDPVTNLDYSPPIKMLADQIGLAKALFYVNSIESTMDRIDHNVNARLALEVLLMDFPKINLIS
jgi:DNA polymerase-3 subunit delta'